MFFPYIQLNSTKTVSIELPNRPDSNNLSGSVYSPGGGSLQTLTMSVDAVNTVLATSASAGATSLALSTSTGIQIGSTYWVGGTEERLGEQVLITSSSGNTVYLNGVLKRSKANGAPFYSTLVSASVGSIGSVGRGYQIRVDYKSGSIQQDTFVEMFDVVRFSPALPIQTPQQMLGYDPLINKKLGQSQTFKDIRDAAWLRVLDRVKARVNPGALLGTSELKILHAMMIKIMIAEVSTNTVPEEIKFLNDSFNAEFDAVVSGKPVDQNEDGVISKTESHSFSTIRLVRG